MMRAPRVLRCAGGHGAWICAGTEQAQRHMEVARVGLRKLDDGACTQRGRAWQDPEGAVEAKVRPTRAETVAACEQEPPNDKYVVSDESRRPDKRCPGLKIRRLGGLGG
eukprot:2425260-Pleurochrysis_carterae.AAC.4